MGKNRDFSKFPNAITVLDNGNVGINTSSPSEQLNLMGANAYTSKIRFTNGASNTGYYTNFGYNSDGNKAYLQIADGGAAATIMTWNYNGNVGIGTNSPSYKLDIGGASSAVLGFSSTGTTSYSEVYFNRNTTTTMGYIGVGVNSSVTANGDDFVIQNSLVGGNLVFRTNSGSNAQERMRITSAGYMKLLYNPAFLAYGSANATIDAAGTYLIYPSIHINRGSNYNASNGVFTAPIAGIYLFSWSAIGGITNDVYRYYLHLNNVNFIGDYQLRLDTGATGSEYGTNGNRNAIVNLSAGDTVRIFFTCSAGSSIYGINDSGNAYHNFMGYFIG